MIPKRCVEFECFATMVDCVPIELEEFVSCYSPSVVLPHELVVLATAEREVELNRLRTILVLVGCLFSPMVHCSSVLDWRTSRA